MSPSTEVDPQVCVDLADQEHLSDREQEFVRYYVWEHDAGLAALSAGYTHGDNTAQRLLSAPKIINAINMKRASLKQKETP